VGFYCAHELAARPYSDPNITNDIALMIYREAQKIDEWAGEDYDGTSVLAGMKVLHRMGLITEYRWAGAGTQTALDDLVRAIAYKGPAGLGIPWYTGMFRPESDGRLRVTGQIEGYHAILAPRIVGEQYRIQQFRRRVYMYNSWGTAQGWPWGWVTWDDMERLLHEDGEAVIPIVRRKAA
jgi:hypothetical protein